MSKDKLTDYSSTAGSNTDIGGVNIDEGMLPSGVNNALREQMSHLADFAAGTTGINVLNLQDDDASHSIKIQAPAAVTADVTLTLPDGDGDADQVLQTNGTGTLAWADIPAGGAGYFQGDNGTTGDTTNGLGDIIRSHQKQLDTNVTIAADVNGLCAGPLTLATGVTVTVTSGGTLVIA